jgi:hypothetical protein
MTANVRLKLKRLYWLRDVLFSIYCALLVISLHESAKDMSWSVSLRNFYVSHRYPDLNRMMDDDYRVAVAAFLLIWALACVIYVFVSVVERFSFARFPLWALIGAVAFLGFPLVCFRFNRAPLLASELAVVGVCVAFWAKGRWPVTNPVNVLLLVIHFVYWSTFGGGYLLVGGQYLMWPGLYRTLSVWMHSWLLFPVLGFTLCLLWALYCPMGSD